MLQFIVRQFCLRFQLIMGSWEEILISPINFVIKLFGILQLSGFPALNRGMLKKKINNRKIYKKNAGDTPGLIGRGGSSIALLTHDYVEQIWDKPDEIKVY